MAFCPASGCAPSVHSAQKNRRCGVKRFGRREKAAISLRADDVSVPMSRKKHPTALIPIGGLFEPLAKVNRVESIVQIVAAAVLLEGGDFRAECRLSLRGELFPEFDSRIVPG